MPEYIARHSFDDNALGKVKRRQSLELSENAAQRYVRAGLLEPVKSDATGLSENPFTAAGTQSSALPAAPVSPATIANKSRRGRRQKADAAFSS